MTDQTKTPVETYGLTATITGRGAASTVPDNEDAVDADIYRDGKMLVSVTLLASRDSRDPRPLVAWGDPDHWCSDYDEIREMARSLEIDSSDVVGVIENIVAEAAR